MVDQWPPGPRNGYRSVLWPGISLPEGWESACERQIPLPEGPFQVYVRQRSPFEALLGDTSRLAGLLAGLRDLS